MIIHLKAIAIRFLMGEVSLAAYWTGPSAAVILTIYLTCFCCHAPEPPFCSLALLIEQKHMKCKQENICSKKIILATNRKFIHKNNMVQ
jgi:hypothetical protein